MLPISVADWPASPLELPGRGMLLLPFLLVAFMPNAGMLLQLNDVSNTIDQNNTVWAVWSRRNTEVLRASIVRHT